MKYKDRPKHLHTIKRIPRKSNEYKCIDPHCKYVCYETRELLVGKFVQCPFCKEPYILKMKDLKLALPNCKCIKGKREEISTDAEETRIAEDILKELEF